MKSDPGSMDEPTLIMLPMENQHTPEQPEDNLSGLLSLNTSEVQFKLSAPFLSYQKQHVRERKVIGKGMVIDSEIDAIPDTEQEVQTIHKESVLKTTVRPRHLNIHKQVKRRTHRKRRTRRKHSPNNHIQEDPE